MNNKNIFTRTIFIFLLGGMSLGFWACTDEDELSQVPSAEQYKNMNSPNTHGKFKHRQYWEYENVCDVKPEQVVNDVNTFDQVLNHGGTLSDKTIKEAILLMETHFNYGVIRNQENPDFETPHSEATFTFDVERSEGQMIKGSTLLQAYRNIVKEIKQKMGRLPITFCDVYVSKITTTQITFAMEIPEYSIGDLMRRLDMPILKPIDAIIEVPDTVVSIWQAPWPHRDLVTERYCFDASHGAFYLIYAISGMKNVAQGKFGWVITHLEERPFEQDTVILRASKVSEAAITSISALWWLYDEYNIASTGIDPVIVAAPLLACRLSSFLGAHFVLTIPSFWYASKMEMTQQMFNHTIQHWGIDFEI